MESLVEQLNNYSRHGVPSNEQNLMSLDDEVIESLYGLEEDWRLIIDPNGENILFIP